MSPDPEFPGLDSPRMFYSSLGLLDARKRESLNRDVGGVHKLLVIFHMGFFSWGNSRIGEEERTRIAFHFSKHPFPLFLDDWNVMERNGGKLGNVNVNITKKISLQTTLPLTEITVALIL